METQLVTNNKSKILSIIRLSSLILNLKMVHHMALGVDEVKKKAGGEVVQNIKYLRNTKGKKKFTGDILN